MKAGYFNIQMKSAISVILGGQNSVFCPPNGAILLTSNKNKKIKLHVLEWSMILQSYDLDLDHDPTLTLHIFDLP